MNSPVSGRRPYVTADRQYLIDLCARLIRLRDETPDRDEKNDIDRELNALRRLLYVTE